MSQNSRPAFTLPEKHHERLRKGLEVVISVDCSFGVNSDTTKHLKKCKYGFNKIVHNSVLERRLKKQGIKKRKEERKRPIEWTDSLGSSLIYLPHQKIELDYGFCRLVSLCGNLC